MVKALPRIVSSHSEHILYDERLFATPPTAAIFAPEKLEEQGLLGGIRSGRGFGSSYHIILENDQWILKHYRRGGLVANVIKDVYFGLRHERSRSWKEWRLLANLYANGLSVPRPVAARVVKGTGIYQADLITRFIPATRTLSERLQTETLPAAAWHAIGHCIRRFHDQGVFHADLNASNILLSSDNNVYLIDFDRGRVRKGETWKTSNLERLKRSLRKMKRNYPNSCFSESDWENLLAGYQRIAQSGAGNSSPGT